MVARLFSTRYFPLLTVVVLLFAFTLHNGYRIYHTNKGEQTRIKSEIFWMFYQAERQYLRLLLSLSNELNGVAAEPDESVIDQFDIVWGFQIALETLTRRNPDMVVKLPVLSAASKQLGRSLQTNESAIISLATLPESEKLALLAELRRLEPLLQDAVVGLINLDNAEQKEHRETLASLTERALASLSLALLVVFSTAIFLLREMQAKDALSSALQVKSDSLEKSQHQLDSAQKIASAASFEYRVSENHLVPSRYLADIMGWTLDEPLPLDALLNAFIDPEQRQVISAMIVTEQVGGMAEAILRLKNEEDRLVEFNLDVSQDSSGAKVIFGTLHDITRLKDAEQLAWSLNNDLEFRVAERTQALQVSSQALKDSNRQLQAARIEAEAASQAKTEFLATISHELRTPMNAILGLTRVCLKTDLTEKQSRMLNEVCQAGEDLNAVINEMLEYAELDAGKIMVIDQSFNLRTVLERVAGVYQWLAERKSLEVRIEVDAELPELILGDNEILHRALLYLFNNAVKFTEQGEVGLNCELRERQGDVLIVRFSVTDTGPGIPGDIQAAIFEAFRQGDGSSTRSHGGTGLGLTLSEKLVRVLGGHIQLYSQENVGSMFCFDIPLKAGKKGHTREDACGVPAGP
ncbi:hypothetical protein OLMES_3915 [Oleiphilus messinensis]|uniref:histidine kinase n=1 Tax=Oleiphilus messinensis TaxID=141451 RepID=A0A1Y0IEN6_9GAMM|nr:ATP-binding protein [Oleiphilus messinensis]ARU57935.1 hypothetical protein OLMES_3915 [Oleiphilus messinensis]